MSQPEKPNKSKFHAEITFLILMLYISIMIAPLLSSYLATISTGSKLLQYDKITIETLDDTSKWKIGTITEVYTTDNIKKYDVTFLYNGDMIECRIPESKYELLNKESRYEINITYTYVKNVYSDIIKNDTSYDKIDDAVLDISTNARVITKADFIFDNYITSGVSSSQEAIDNLTELYEISTDSEDITNE